MKINLAHMRERSTKGDWVDFAVFDAKSSTGTNAENDALLYMLTDKIRASGFKVDQSALAYDLRGRIRFYGDKNLVKYLAREGLPRWTHQVDLQLEPEQE